MQNLNRNFVKEILFIFIRLYLKVLNAIENGGLRPTYSSSQELAKVYLWNYIIRKHD